MANTAVVFDILARDNASDKFDHLGNSIGGTSTKMSKFTGVMKTAGKAAAIGLGAGLVLATGAAIDFAKRAAEDEQGAKLMATAFKNNANATSEQIDATEKWITAQGKAFGVADDDLRPALSRLITSTHDVGDAQKLAALAMDVSAGSGKSLESISTALMKANNGQVSALSRLGINTKLTSDEQVAYAKAAVAASDGSLTMEDALKRAASQTITMDQATKRMSDTFGGAASAKAGTLQGKMDRLKVIFNETKESIGAHLIPVVSDFADVLINKVVPNIAPVASKLGEIAKLGWEKLQDGAGALRDLYEKAKPFIELGWENVKDAVGYLGDLGQKAKDALTPLTDLSTFDAATFGKNLGSAVASALDALVNLAGTVTSKLATMFGKVDWVGLGINMGKQVPALLTGIAVGILAFDPMPILIGLKDHWGDVLIAVLAIAFAPSKIAGGLGKILAKIPFVGKFMEHAVVWLNELGGKLLSFGGDLLQAMWRGFTGGAALPGASLVARVLAALKGIPGAVSGFFDDLATKLGVWALDAFEAMGRGARTKVGELVSFAGTIGGKILRGLGSLGSLLFNAGVSIIQGLISGVTSKIGELEGLFKSITSKIPDWKGPADKDSVLLTPAGVKIMEGLIKGIDKGKVKLKTVLEQVTDYIQKHGEKLSKLLDKRQGIIDSFKGMTSSVFGADMTANPETGLGPTVSDLLGFQQAKRAQAERLQGDVRNLTQKGLSNDLINQLMGAGESGQEQIHLLASATEDQIKQLNADNAATQLALQAAGVAASKALGVEQAIAQEQRDIKLAKGIREELEAWRQQEDRNTTFSVTLDGKQLEVSINKSRRRDGKPPL